MRSKFLRKWSRRENPHLIRHDRNWLVFPKRRYWGPVVHLRWVDRRYMRFMIGHRLQTKKQIMFRNLARQTQPTNTPRGE